MDKGKQSLYLNEQMASEIREEAARLDRSLSWVVQRAWKLARGRLASLPPVLAPAGSEPQLPSPPATANQLPDPPV